MPDLTVVTGMPGTRVRRSLRKFAGWCADNHAHEIRIISLEETLQDLAQPLVREHFGLPATSVVQTFLLPRAQLRRIWRQAWNETMSKADAELKEHDVVLTFHSTYFHQLTREYFVAADMPELIRDLSSRAKRIITFIDDAYDCHQSLIAGGSASGMMKAPESIDEAVLDLIQVFDWRSIEIMQSESIAASIERPFYIFATKHPLSTLYDLMFSGKRIVYLSHPISEPRRLHSEGKISEARDFVQTMETAVARMQANATVIEPTAIDEKRFHGETGSLSGRWPFRSDGRELVYEEPEEAPPQASDYLFPVGWRDDNRVEVEFTGLIKRLSRVISEQIDARDHGLVEQANIVASYRPIYEGHMSRGVREELEHHGRLVSLDLRRPEASIVYCPPEDLSTYPRRQLAGTMVGTWVRQSLLVGSEESIEELKARVLTEHSQVMDDLVQGDADALMRVVADCSLRIRPDDQILPSGALGASDAARRQATAGLLGEQIRRTGEVYLDRLQNAGTIVVVETAQMFYDRLAES